MYKELLTVALRNVNVIYKEPKPQKQKVESSQQRGRGWENHYKSYLKN